MQDKYKEGNPLVSHCAREISRINKFRLDPATLARPSRLPDTLTDELQETRPPRLDYSGDGLAGVLYFLAETANPMIDVVAAKVSEAIDGFEGFEFNTVGADRIGFSARFEDSRGIVPAANLSDGTLSLIGLLVLLTNPDRPPVLCLEEPENGLTPRATRAVYEGMVAASGATAPEVPSQVLISSHSPFVICAAWNGDEREFIYQVKPESGPVPHPSVCTDHRRAGDSSQQGPREAGAPQPERRRSGDGWLLLVRSSGRYDKVRRAAFAFSRSVGGVKAGRPGALGGSRVLLPSEGPQ